jgi:hypothetical protein
MGGGGWKKGELITYVFYFSWSMAIICEVEDAKLRTV